MFKNSSEIKLSVAKFCPLKKSKSVVVLLHSGCLNYQIFTFQENLLLFNMIHRARPYFHGKLRDSKIEGRLKKRKKRKGKRNILQFLHVCSKYQVYPICRLTTRDLSRRGEGVPGGTKDSENSVAEFNYSGQGLMKLAKIN